MQIGARGKEAEPIGERKREVEPIGGMYERRLANEREGGPVNNSE